MVIHTYFCKPLSLWKFIALSYIKNKRSYYHRDIENYNWINNGVMLVVGWCESLLLLSILVNIVQTDKP